MKKILVIDDDKDLSTTIKAILEYNGYNVFLSHEPRQGIDTAKQQKPDLILMDIMLPEMNGAEAVKILKSDENLKNIPVIFLTALVSNEEKDLEPEKITVDGNYYQTLAKPFENKKLLEIVDSVFTPEIKGTNT